MGLPPNLSKMEVQEVMASFGYVKSLLPTQDVDIYVRGNERVSIDFANDWDLPSSDFITMLRIRGISEDAIVSAYRDLYPD